MSYQRGQAKKYDMFVSQRICPHDMDEVNIAALSLSLSEKGFLACFEADMPGRKKLYP